MIFFLFIVAIHITYYYCFHNFHTIKKVFKKKINFLHGIANNYLYL